MRSFKLAKEGPRSSVKIPIRKVYDPETANSHIRARPEVTKDLRVSRASHPANVASGFVERRDEDAQNEAQKRDDIMEILAGMSNEEIERLKQKLHVLDEQQYPEEEKSEADRHAGEVAEELLSVYSKKSQHSRIEERSVRSAAKSQHSSKTAASLQQQLREERDARRRLEKELEEIKRISSEMSSHLGMLQQRK